MRLLTRFVVLIESRRLHKAAVATVTSIAMLLPGFGLGFAHAAPNPRGAAKVAQDLDDEVRGASRVRPKWSRQIGGVQHVQAILVSNSADPSMADLRAHVLRLGGSVHAVHAASRSITVQVKASDLDALAQRSDVLSASPNSETQRTASMVETVTGAINSGVRTYSSK
jgi:hypothetical protein